MSVFIRSNLGQSNISDPISSSHPTEHWTQEAAHRIVIRAKSGSEFQQHYHPLLPFHRRLVLTEVIEVMSANDTLVIPDQFQVGMLSPILWSDRVLRQAQEREEGMDNLNPDRYRLPLAVWGAGLCKWDYSGYSGLVCKHRE